MPTSFIQEPIEKSELSEIAKERFGDLVKGVVDIEQGIMVIGAEWVCCITPVKQVA